MLLFNFVLKKMVSYLQIFQMFCTSIVLLLDSNWGLLDVVNFGCFASNRCECFRLKFSQTLRNTRMPILPTLF